MAASAPTTNEFCKVKAAVAEQPDDKFVIRRRANRWGHAGLTDTRSRLLPLRLLVVEDEAKLSLYLHRGLSENGHFVDAAPDRTQGRHRFKLAPS